MNRRQLLVLFAALLAAAILAFLLREVIQVYIILPLARLFWQIRLVYLAIPQVVFWVLLLVALVIFTANSFSLRSRTDRLWRSTARIRYGEVQQMAFWLQRSRRGIYSKWHVANSLANIALDILQQRSGEAKRSMHLSGPGWNPPADIQKYLETGLRTTYADYPRPGIFSRRQTTPFDRDLEPVVAYLESLMEEKHDPQHS
jgi:hypothetical protein